MENEASRTVKIKTLSILLEMVVCSNFHFLQET